MSLPPPRWYRPTLLAHGLNGSTGLNPLISGLTWKTPFVHNVTMGDFYLFLASDDSLDFYPLNTPGHFSIKLPETMHMDGSWMCALRDLQCKTTSPTDLLVF